MVLDVGSTLDPVTLDAALRLGSLRPADVGSGARNLVLRLDDQNGFTMRTQPASGRRIFGFYTPTLRTTDLDPGPGRLLRSLLAGREDSVAAGDPCRRPQRDLRAQGSPDPTSSAKPTATPGPRRRPSLRRRPGLRRRRGRPRPRPRRRARPRDRPGARPCDRRCPASSGSVGPTFTRTEAARPCSCPSWVSFSASRLGSLLNVNVSYELSRYSAVAILAALDSVLGAVRAELDGVYDNRIFVSGFLTNAIVAVLLTFIGDRLSLDLYLVALINFGFRIFNNVALIRRHFI